MIMDHQKRRASQKKETQDTERSSTQIQALPLREQELWNNRSEIDSLVKALPPQEKWIVLFVFQEGLHPREISEILGVTANTVRIRLFRALDRLRKKTGDRSDE